MQTIPLGIDGEARVVTKHSVWLVRADSFCRMPRAEAPRRASSPTMGGPCQGVPPTTTPFGATGSETYRSVRPRYVAAIVRKVHLLDGRQLEIENHLAERLLFPAVVPLRR